MGCVPAVEQVERPAGHADQKTENRQLEQLAQAEDAARFGVLTALVQCVIGLALAIFLSPLLLAALMLAALAQLRVLRNCSKAWSCGSVPPSVTPNNCTRWNARTMSP